MKISKIEIMAADVPFKGHQENVGEIALGKWKTCRFVIVKVHTDEGIVGHGESAPFARLSQLGQKPIADILVDYLAPAVIGKDPFDVEAIWKAMDRATPYASQAKGAIDMAQLVKTSLRMRPDRIVIGEVRGSEVFDMINAMNTGHSGSLSTGHANSISGMIKRLEVYADLGDEGDHRFVTLEALGEEIE